jgi:ribosomal protein L11 methyltransferase
MCLDWLARYPPREARVLDYGSGSGILGLAALALGAQCAWAVDHDPQALIATEDNAGLNDRITALWIGPAECLPAIEVDLVLANIVAGTLIELAPRFAACMRPGATVVMSGILQDQHEAVEAAYSRSFESFEVATQEQWLRITARRKRCVE